MENGLGTQITPTEVNRSRSGLAPTFARHQLLSSKYVQILLRRVPGAALDSTESHIFPKESGPETQSVLKWIVQVLHTNVQRG